VTWLHLFQDAVTLFRWWSWPPIICGDPAHGGSECVLWRMIAALQCIDGGNGSDHEKALLKPCASL
jgi:hypothetical protein